MSALGGIYARLGQPVELAFLKKLSRALEPLGPDGESLVCAPPVGMVHRPFHVDLESRFHTQPLVTTDGYVVGLDGRLDNADEIKDDLRGVAPVDRSINEAGLVLSVYRAWGILGFGRLVGDFAFALWDPDRHHVVLACDGLGRRPLYYFQTPGQLIWSSRARAILDSLGIPYVVEEEFVADFVTNWTPSKGPFKGVVPLRGGHALLASRAGIAVTRYWSLTEKEIRYSSDDEYEQHFRHVLREAVACRLRAEGPVFCELSGGIDSSSIACVAHELAPRCPIVTVSYVFDQARNSDERPYVRLVEQQLGRTGIHISEDEHPMLTAVPRTLQPDLPANGLAFIARYDALAQQMRRHGARVVLSGVGGDQLFWSEPPEGLPLADDLAEGRILALLRSCPRWSQLAQRHFLGMLWTGACWPLLPRRWRAITQNQNPVGEWFTAGFVRRTDLTDRVLGMEDDIGFHPPSRSLQYVLIRQTMRTYALEPALTEGYREVRYPYLDRRLVEFALAIPLHQKLRPGETRSLVRRALKGVLPEGVRQRTTKAGPTEAFHRAIVHAWPWLTELMCDPRVTSHGFVDRTAFVLALRRARHGLTTNAVQLLKTLALEIWLRSLEPVHDADVFGSEPALTTQEVS